MLRQTKIFYFIRARLHLFVKVFFCWVLPFFISHFLLNNRMAAYGLQLPVRTFTTKPDLKNDCLMVAMDNQECLNRE
jgi:hypothetical protein